MAASKAVRSRYDLLPPANGAGAMSPAQARRAGGYGPRRKCREFEGMGGYGKRPRTVLPFDPAPLALVARNWLVAAKRS